MAGMHTDVHIADSENTWCHFSGYIIIFCEPESVHRNPGVSIFNFLILCL